ncbi:fasciclin domain-containing protein [Aestuariivivens sediminicola]|uniref:fasciclin domain-containing protein n=1 Tax=Aestuariivivens sediminicola TaxID=2913560 RepID=UPI001F5714A2|nr:fasciclin domain-containing protein [Aestuariivivens sediminicola]
MKITKVFKIMVLTLTISVMNLSCMDDDAPVTINPQEMTITELALASPNLSGLVEALNRADGNLASVLNGSGPFTVLAPTNDAFQALLDSEPSWNQISDIDPAVLQQVLLNHVISGDVKSTDLVSAGSGYAKTNADGAGGEKMSLYFDTSNGVMFNGTASVVENGADITAMNGTIHIIDQVIGLPSIATFAVANPDFKIVAGALTPELVNVLSSPGTFTVLLPDNDAFAALPSIPTGDALVNVLLNHVLGDVVMSSTLVDLGAGYSNTLATGPDMNYLSLYFDATDGVMFNGLSSVTEADIVATNGVIHAVDQVITLPTIATFAVSNPALSLLVETLAYADSGTPTVPYLTTVSDPNAGPFTVFAPTNDAFADLLAELNASALTDIATETVDAVLLHHIVGANVQSGQLQSGPVPTLGGDVTADTSNFTIIDANDRVSNIVTSLIDIQAINGVVHVIDKVILPPTP